MVSDELLLLMYPMNSMDICGSCSRCGNGSDTKREASRGDARGVLLRGIDAAAQRVAGVALARLGAGQPVIRRRGGRGSGCGSPVPGAGELDDAGFRRGQD